jgi:predicted ABC-type ATPase
MENEEDTNSKINALRISQIIGCSGAHKSDGKWMPCETHEELESLSNAAEPKTKNLEILHTRYQKRKRKGKKQWDKLKERKPLGFATLEGGGIVSAPIVAFPNVELFSSKAYIPGVTPRDNDPDVFTDIESARKRSRMLGCIGVRRMPSATGKTIWMPCTNNTDYARVAGTTFLGRRNQQEAQRRVVRTIVRREMANASKNGVRKKSLFDEMYESKGIGRVIGRVNGSGSLTRRMRRSLAKIEGVLNPFERRDVDGDGMIFDGTWREMPDPSTAKPNGLASRVDTSPSSAGTWWHSPTDNSKWFTPQKVKKGGALKAQELLNFDRVRLRKNRDEQAQVLGVSREVIDAMHKPDASIDPYDADRLAMSALKMHPALIWGESWLESDPTPDNIKEPKINKRGEVDGRTNRDRLGEIDDRDENVLELRRQGKNFDEIGKELGVSRQRARQLHTRAVQRNEKRIDRSGGLSSTTELGQRGSGMISRDERGRPIREVDKRKETLQRSIDKLKELGLSDEEINLLMTGDRDTPVDVATHDVDIATIKRDTRSGLSSSTGGLRSMSLSQMANSNPDTWPQNQKIHIVDWANSRPTFNVPYSLAQQFKQDGDLPNKDWKRLLTFYTKYGPENRGGLRSSTTTGNFTDVGAKRMVEIILGRVNEGRQGPDKTHYHIVGPGGMGKTTLRNYLMKEGLIPSDSQAAHVDPDFIKQGITGYNGGSGSVAVHRESAHAATHAVNTAAKTGIDIVTEGTGYRLYDYKTTSDPNYRKVLHIPYLPFDIAEARVRERNKAGGRQLPPEQVRAKGVQFYSWLMSHLQRGEVQNMYIWDMDVPEGAAPRVIAKIEDGVFRAIDEPAFKKWSEQSGGQRGGDSNLAWFKRHYPENK